MPINWEGPTAGSRCYLKRSRGNIGGVSYGADSMEVDTTSMQVIPTCMKARLLSWKLMKASTAVAGKLHGIEYLLPAPHSWTLFYFHGSKSHSRK